MNVTKQNRFPFTPFPDGWYWIEFSENLPRGKLISKKWMGEKIVVWRDRVGKVCVANAFCPHMGALLAPECGGELTNDQLKCPFHGFQYDVSGNCVETPQGTLKRKLQLATYPVDEVNGVVLAFWSNTGTAPTWNVEALDQEGWSSYSFASREIRTHPQETSENGVDAAHLTQVHWYYDLVGGRKISIDGPCLKNQFSMKRDVGWQHLGFTMEVSADITIWGLGYSLIEPRVPEIGLEVRQLAMSTPIDGEKVEFVMALQMRHIDKPNKLLPGLGIVPKDLLRYYFQKLFFTIYKKDIYQDFDIWENKRYLLRPMLGHVDGPIMQFRNYCEQFYPACSDAKVIASTTKPTAINRKISNL